MKIKKYTCENCKSEVNVHDKFCSGCGSKLEQITDRLDLNSPKMPSAVKKNADGDYNEDDIEEVIETMTEKGEITERDLKVSKGSSPSDFTENIRKAAKLVYNEVKSNSWPSKLKKDDILNILYGIIYAVNM